MTGVICAGLDPGLIGVLDKRIEEALNESDQKVASG